MELYNMTDVIPQTPHEGNPPIVTDTPAPVASPIVNPPDPADDAAANPPADTGDANASGDPAGTPPAVDPSKPATPEWAQKRINELTASRHAAERLAKAETDRRLAVERVNADLLAARAGQPPAAGDPAAAHVPPANTPQMTEEEIDRRALEKAQQIAETTRFNETCNRVADTGKTEFKDWDDAVKNLGLVGALGPNVSPDFLATAIELKSPHKVLHYLGSNLEEAEKIAKMTPVRMAMEMARVEAIVNAPVITAPVVVPPVSNAPAPIVAVSGKAVPGGLAIDDPDISMEQFAALRNKQLEEKRMRHRR